MSLRLLISIRLVGVWVWKPDFIPCPVPPHRTWDEDVHYTMGGQGPQGVDGSVVHWYVTRLENPCQLFRQLTNVGDTSYIVT